MTDKFTDVPVGAAVERVQPGDVIPVGATRSARIKVTTPAGMVLGEVWAERSTPDSSGRVHEHWKARDRGQYEDVPECYAERDDAVAMMYQRQGVPIPG